MDWNDLKYFLSVARTGSLTQAAIDCQVSPSTVSRRITVLEKCIGTSLFIRHQTGYFLTDIASDIVESARTIENDISALERIISNINHNPSGKVRLAVPENFATYIVIPKLPQFIASYPDIQIEFVTGVNTVGLARNEVDIALRLIRPEKGNLLIKKIGKIDSAIYGSTQYLLHHPVIDQSLSQHAFIT